MVTVSSQVNGLYVLSVEHRNMPVDDAITLITRSFDKYMLDRRERTDGAGARPPGDGQNLQPSARIQYLLNLLADQRHMTAVELTLVIDYLVERRRKMDSSGDGAPRSGWCKIYPRQSRRIMLQLFICAFVCLCAG